MQKFNLLYYSISKYQPENMKFLSDNFNLIELESPDQDSTKVLSKIDAIVAPLGYQMDQRKIEQCNKLKVIGSNTTGHPHIDVSFAKSKGISVITLKNEKTFLDEITPSAELTWGLLISLTRNIIPASEFVKTGSWDRRPFGGESMLSRLKIGIVGLGRLGTMVSEYALTFGMEVYFFDPNRLSFPPRINKCPSLEDLVSKVDVISIHVPHEKETENMFDERILSFFKKKSYLINTSRGELIDHSALLKKLEDGHIAGAAIDVFENEFEPQFKKSFSSHRLLEYAKRNSNLIITPHIAGSTRDAWFETERYTIKKMLKTLINQESKIVKVNIMENKIFALIPARGGSKSVPLKNMALLNNRPLIDYVINSAKKTSLISRIICSTDNPIISSYCEKNSIEVQDRPDKLSGDNISTIDVIIYFLNQLLNSENSLPEYLVLLEPTSPFVNSEHIEMCIKALRSDLDASSAQTVARVSSNSHAYNQRYHDEGGSHFLFRNERKTSKNKQTKPEFFIHGNVRVMRVNELFKTEELFGKKSIPIEISRVDAMDVDGPTDFDLAERIIESGYLNKN